MAAFRVARPDVAFIAYASLDGASLHAIARLAREGNFFHHVLVREADCSGYTLRKAIERAGAHGLVNQVLGRLERDLSALPEDVARTLFDLFARPARYSDVSDLATESRVKVHTLYRTFQHAHLRSPRKFLTLAKVCRACFLLRHCGMSVSEVALQLRYDRVNTLAENCAQVFGCSPSTLRIARDQDELALALLDWLYKPHWREKRPPPPVLGAKSCFPQQKVGGSKSNRPD